MQKIYYEIRKLTLICSAIIFSPIFYYLISRRRKVIQKKGQLRILVIPQLTRVGDLVCVTPVFRAIKKQYSNSFLAVLVTNKVAGIIKNNPRIDEIIVYKSIDFASRVLPEIRKKCFNWSFCLSGTAIGTLITFFGLIPNQVKLAREGRPISEFLTDWLNYKVLYRHHTYLIKFYLKLLKFININDAEGIKEVFTMPKIDYKIKDFLLKNNINNNNFLVGISVTAGNKIKEWGDENLKKSPSKLSENRIKIILDYMTNYL
jgi:ADP-heptose:LPS heptosyltransferase